MLQQTFIHFERQTIRNLYHTIQTIALLILCIRISLKCHKIILNSWQVQIQLQSMENNVRVTVRLRPLLSHENQPAWMAKQNSLIALHPHSRAIKMSSNQHTSSSKEPRELQHEFNFQSIVPENESSEQLYKKFIKPTLIECCHSHRNISIMAYGQTCSGKTHTILGVKEAPGIIPCVLRDLFKSAMDKNYRMKISYLQIYNQKLRDLLDKKNVDKQMKIVEDVKWNCDVSGTIKEPIKSFEESIKLLEKGQKDRQYGQGQRHERSSRSHTLFRIFVEEWDSDFNSKAFTITIVDLAGSERLVSSSQSTSEAGFINKSLFQFANVISKLGEQSQHIPYRDSKLTRILEPSLSSNGRTILICCVSPSISCYGETLSTLRLAERAKKIKLPQQPEEPKEEALELLREKLRQKSRECTQLKKQIQALNQKIAQQQDQISKLKSHCRTNTAKKTNKCDMLILLDHENFTLFLGNSLQQQILEYSKTAKIKEQFISKMQQLYETYTQEILQLYNGDKFQMKIQQICFMNMVLEHQRIAEYKLVVIDELLKEKQDKFVPENFQFYKALQKYRGKLVQEIPRSSVSFVLEQLCEKQDPSNKTKSYHTNDRKQNVSKLLNIGVKQQEHSSQLLVWGSKKDYRVCKGQSYKLNMTKIASIKNIISVACGYHHTLVVSAQGKLYGWGKNTQCQLLPSSKESISSPIEVNTQGRVRSAAAGWGHSLIVNSEGRVYSWGYGKDGQLGLGTTQSEPNPTHIQHQLQILSVFAGHSHSAFLDSNRDLYLFGFNQDYRLMIGDEKIVLTPRRIAIRDIRTASLGVSHSAVVTESGLVYCGGVGTHGELGVVLNESHSGWEKIEVADRQFENQPFEKVCPLVQVDCFSLKRKALDVKCGQNTTFVLSDTGQLWSFGKSAGGRTGHKNLLPTKILQNIDKVSTGPRHALAYNSRQGKLYSWGFNLYGQANPSISGDILSPQLIQLMEDRPILGIELGFFHSVVMLK